MKTSNLVKGDKGQIMESQNIEMANPSGKVLDRIVDDQYRRRGTIEKDIMYAPWPVEDRSVGGIIDVLTGEDHENRDADFSEKYRRSLQGKLDQTNTGGAWGGNLPGEPGDEEPFKGDLKDVNNLLSIETEVSEEDKIDLAYSDPRADLPERRLKQRAAKGAIAISEDPAQLEIEMSDPQGEGMVRERASYKNADEFRKAKSDYLDEILKTRDPSKPMSLEEATFISGMTSDEFTPWDPDAIEKLYAEKITQRLYGSTPVAQAADTEEYHNIQDAVEQNVMKHEMALKKAEDTRQSYDSETGTFGHIWNWTEQLVPFKSDITKYDSEMSSWLPGSNMADQVRNLWLLPPKAFKAKLDEGYDLIAAHNPLDAQDWLESVLSYSRMSEGLANVFFGVDVATSLPVGWIFKSGKVVKAGVDAGKATERLTRPAGEVTEHFRATDGLTTTVKDTLKPTVKTQEFVTAKGEKTPVFTIGDRIVAVVDINGVQQPFYISTGKGGKKSIKQGSWQPFFGIGEDGWFNKGSEAQIKTFYNSPALKAAAEHLDKSLGDIRKKTDSLPKGFQKGAIAADWQLENSVDITDVFSGIRSTTLKDSASNSFIGEQVSALDNASRAKLDGERLLEGWDVGEIDFPEDFRAAQAGKQIQQALMKEELKYEDVLAKTGHQEKAVDATVAKRTVAMEKPPVDARDPSEFVNLSNTLDSFYNPRAWLDTGSRLTREQADRIMIGVNNAKLKLTEIAADPAQAMRLGVIATERAIELTKSRMRNEFRFANDGIIDSKWIPRTQDDNPDSQINELVMTIGTPDGLAFNDPVWAKQTADHTYKLRPGDYQIEQVGTEYYIQVKRPVDERDASVTSAMIETNNETPKSLANTFLGWFRNPDDLLSPAARENRKQVTGIGQNIQKYFADAIEPVSRLSGKQKERLSRMMQINRDEPAGDGRRGYWYSGVSEYEQKYYDAFKQYPTEAETQAYMITRELSDFDWSVRSLTILRDKSRQGIVNVHLKVPKKVSADDSADLDLQRMSDDGGPATETFRTEMADESFEGKLLDSLPEFNGHDAGVYVMKEGESTGELKYLSDIDRDEIKRLVDEEGYKVYQQSDNMNNPFAGVDNKTADRQFIIVKNAQTSNLRAEDMLPYRAGYHVEYAPGFYTKQGQFFRDGKGRLTYSGDRSLIYHVSEAAAKKYTTAMNQARLLLKAGETEQLKLHLAGTLPHTYEQFVRLFGDGTLDLDTPVLYTRSGQNTRDSVRGGQQGSELYDTSRDAYNSPYNLSTFVNRQFAQEKDLALPSIAKGSEGNPEFSFVPSKLIDPLSSLSRSMHNMTRMRVYDNYQYQALTSFVEEFGNPATLGGSVTKRSLDSIRQNPLAFITDPMWNDKTLSRDKLAAAKNAHRSIVNLLGVQSELNKNVDWVLNKMVDTIFEKYGDGAATKASDFLHTKIRDPARYARSIAFHTKLGLFNPVQLFLQAQSVVHAVAVTGNLKRSYQAAGAAFFMRRLSLTNDEAIINSFAKKAKAFGWKEEEFLESFENMKLSGIWHVEGEVADLNDIFGTNMFTSKGKRFLSKGTFFFQEGERTVRLNAWNTAYKEWKLANPTKKLGNRERGEILRRYDDLAINMTRSSTGAWQQGILSVPAQFSTYQIHLAEQMLGKRLTTAEKARALATYSALYGIPTGIAAGTAVWPWGQDIKQAAMERGISTNDGVMDTLLNGIMATSFEAITGREYNFSERYGPNGLTFFKEALNGKKGLVAALLGPSGQIGSDILKGLDPVADSLLSIFNDDNTSWPLVVEDFGNAFSGAIRNVSTANNAYQMFYAMNAGKFISKNEMFTAKADAMDGVMTGIFGLSPRSVSDAYIKIESMQEFRQAQLEAQKEFVKEYRRAMENYSDPAAFKHYMTRARSWIVMGGFRPDQMEDLVRAANKGDTSLIENIERQFLKNAPVDQIDDRFNQQRNK